MSLIRMTLTFDGLDSLEAETLETELANLAGITVKALRTRDPGIVDSFLIGLAANAISALAAVLIRLLKKQPTVQRVVSIEMRIPGQYLKFESTDNNLDEQLIKQQIANLFMSNSSNEKHE